MLQIGPLGLMGREQDVERLCSSFGAALRYIGSHALRKNNQPMVSRDWAEQRIHECIVASPCRFWPALNLGLRAISVIRKKEATISGGLSS